MRRVRWIFATVVVGVAAVGLAVGTSRRCELMVYNEGVAAIAGLSVRSDEFVWSVPILEEGESRREVIEVALPAGLWRVVRADGAEMAEVWFEPGPGRKLVVRVFDPEAVDVFSQTAWWE